VPNDPYRDLGQGYSRQRRPDPRIAAVIDRALGDAVTVVNVGAGAGSYEPADRRVLAVEPSPTMLAQRPATAAPAVRATAERLPLPDGAVDAGLAVLTVHHWRDHAAGLAELARVSRRQVVLTWDAEFLARSFWLAAEYLPEIERHEAGLACVDEIAAELARHNGHVEVSPVPVPADCTDGFLAAFWRRPQAYLDPAVRASTSGLAVLPPEVVDRAIARLTADLADGRWHRLHRDLLDRDALDLGYRLVVAGPGPTP
jgi:SAM-dependent methyltransferase